MEISQLSSESNSMRIQIKATLNVCEHWKNWIISQKQHD